MVAVAVRRFVWEEHRHQATLVQLEFGRRGVPAVRKRVRVQQIRERQRHAAVRQGLDPNLAPTQLLEEPAATSHLQHQQLTAQGIGAQVGLFHPLQRQNRLASVWMVRPSHPPKRRYTHPLYINPLTTTFDLNPPVNRLLACSFGSGLRFRRLRNWTTWRHCRSVRLHGRQRRSGLWCPRYLPVLVDINDLMWSWVPASK